MLKVVPGEAALIYSNGGVKGLLVSDLHLGLEKELAKKGFNLPSYSVKMLERIKGIAERGGAERAIILGDVKHSVGKVRDIDWSILPWFFGTLLDLFSSVDVVPGNHDGGIKPLLPPRVKLHSSHGAVLGEGDEMIGVSHGHAWPSAEVISTGKMVIGHSHYTFEMKDKLGARSRESVWLFGRYDLGELLAKAGYEPLKKKRGRGELIVMPPFNRMVGGQPINRKEALGFGPILSSGCIDLDEADIFLLDGTRVS